MIASASPPPHGFQPLRLGQRIRLWIERMQQTPGISLIGELFKRLTGYTPKVATLFEALVSAITQVAGSLILMITATVLATVAWLRRSPTSTPVTLAQPQPVQRPRAKK